MRRYFLTAAALALLAGPTLAYAQSNDSYSEKRVEKSQDTAGNKVEKSERYQSGAGGTESSSSTRVQSGTGMPSDQGSDRTVEKHSTTTTTTGR